MNTTDLEPSEEMSLQDLSVSIVSAYEATGLKFVFAESCTGGLAGASIVETPGASQVFCGGQVVYRTETKQSWLGLPLTILEKNDAVNPEVAAALAEKILTATPEAHVAVSITGHLGPDAPEDLDGLCFLGLAVQLQGLGSAATSVELPTHETQVFRLLLNEESPQRVERQRLASHALLQVVRSVLP